MAKTKSKSLAKQKSSVAIPVKKEVVSTEVVIASLEKQASPAIKKLARVTKVTSKAEFDAVAEQIKLLKEIDKIAIKEENEMTSGIKHSLARIKAHFKPFHDKVSTLETNYKLMMSVWLEKNDKKLAQVTEAFVAGDIKKVSTFAEKTSALQISNEGSAGKVKQISKLFINDVSKIPREFMVPDEAAIIAAFKNGENVAGCEYKKVKTIAI